MQEEPLANILSVTEDLFNKFGIKSVSMEDVCAELAMSKKTLYQHFPSKEALIKKVLENKIQQIECSMQQCSTEESSAVEDMFAIFEAVISNFKDHNPILIFDLRKYYPGVYKYFEEFRQKQIGGEFRDNLLKGIAQGVYRTDLNIELIGRLYFTMVEMITGPELVSVEPDFRKRYTAVLAYHLYGICTSKGIIIIEKLKNEKHTH
jgi:hypothetical protein